VNAVFREFEAVPEIGEDCSFGVRLSRSATAQDKTGCRRASQSVLQILPPDGKVK
jgi:hypothetical protein